MAHTNDIEKRCTRPSQTSPHHGSRPNEQWLMWQAIPEKIKKMYGPLAFKLWYEKEPENRDYEMPTSEASR